MKINYTLNSPAVLSCINNTLRGDLMRNIVKHALLAIALIVFVVPNSFAERKFLVVGEEFAPFEFEQGGKVVGIDVDIATHIFKKLGIEVEFKILPWRRAWSMVEAGEADAVLTTSRKSKREPFVWYPKEDMWVSEFVFFNKVDKKMDAFNGYESAKSNNLKVGVINGNSYHDSFWQAFPYADGSIEFKGEDATDMNKQLKVATSLKENLQKLAGGRIDIFAADKVYGAYTVKLLGLQDQLGYYDAVLYSKGYPMPFVKKSTYPDVKSIADKFEAELIEMKNNGEYQKIFDKWLK